MRALEKKWNSMKRKREKKREKGTRRNGKEYKFDREGRGKRGKKGKGKALEDERVEEGEKERKGGESDGEEALDRRIAPKKAARG